MPKFNVHSDYFDHPKVQRLKVYCGEEADIFPIRLWGFCAKHFPATGILKDYTESEVERVLGWKGVPGNLIRALVSLGFLDKKKNFYGVHGWKEHAGFINTYKIKAKEMAKARWAKHAVSNAASIQDGNANESKRKEKKRIKTKDIVAPSAIPSLQALFVEKFKASYERLTEQPFKADRLHYVLAATLIKDHGYEAVVAKTQLLGVFCRERSAWFTKDGWADFKIETLSKHWNSIIPSAPSSEVKDETFLRDLKKQEERNERSDALIERR